MTGFYYRFLESVARWPRHIAIELQRQHGDIERLTYSELRSQAESVGAWLEQQSGPNAFQGARCAILADNGPRWVAAYLGTLAAGRVAVLLDTSGTTSDPKGVMLTHANLLGEADAVFKFLKVTPTDSVLGILPLFHALAQMANLLLPFAAGARVVYLETLNTTELLRGLREREITLFACVPQFFYLIHERVMKQVAGRPLLQRAAFRFLMRLS